MKAAIFGATLSAKSIYEDIKKTYEVIAYCDNDKRKWGGKMYDGVEIINPQCLLSLQWDEVIIISLSAMNVIKNGWNASGKKPSSKYTSDSSPFPIAGPAHSTRPVRRSLFHSPCFSFRQPFRPLSFSCRGIFLSPISPEDAFIHNWTAAASHPA